MPDISHKPQIQEAKAAPDEEVESALPSCHRFYNKWLKWFSAPQRFLCFTELQRQAYGKHDNDSNSDADN